MLGLGLYRMNRSALRDQTTQGDDSDSDSHFGLEIGGGLRWIGQSDWTAGFELEAPMPLKMRLVRQAKTALQAGGLLPASF